MNAISTPQNTPFSLNRFQYKLSIVGTIIHEPTVLIIQNKCFSPNPGIYSTITATASPSIVKPTIANLADNIDFWSV